MCRSVCIVSLQVVVSPAVSLWRVVLTNPVRVVIAFPSSVRLTVMTVPVSESSHGHCKCRSRGAALRLCRLHGGSCTGSAAHCPFTAGVCLARARTCRRSSGASLASSRSTPPMSRSWRGWRPLQTSLTPTSPRFVVATALECLPFRLVLATLPRVGKGYQHDHS